MKALILAAGTCTRLRPLTADRHKCLVEVAPPLTVLDIELEALAACGVEEVVIVVGYCGDKIREHLAQHHPRRKVTFVENADFATTNCIYSVWLAREHVLGDGLIFLTGDLVFDASVLRQLMAASAHGAMYVHPTSPLPEKDFKARIDAASGLITEIGLDAFGPDARACWPLYWLSVGALDVWMQAIDAAVRSGEKKVNAEVAFNRVAREVGLSPAYITDFCTEIDDRHDLERAKAHYAAR